MRTGRTLALVVMALLAGVVVSQLPSAMGDSENPISALWDAIFDLQSRDDDLQAQIDELRAERDALLVETGTYPTVVSDPYAGIEIETTEDGHTLIHITAGNSGPDRAAGVKLTAFYLMPLFEINSIDGGMCEDKSRGIIECVIGTLEEGQESVITVDATAREYGTANTWTVDISTTTDDADHANNHVTYDFETGSGEPIEIPEVKQPVQEPEENVEESEAAEPEQENAASNSTGTDSDSTSTETEVPQEISNQTSTETTGGNQTSTENESEETSGNQTSSETEETSDDSGSNSTATEGSDVSEEPEQESSAEQENSDGGAQEEQPTESSETGEEQADEGVTEEQPEEQATSEESGVEESPEDSEESDNGDEGSGSEESESEDSSGSESGDGGENPQ